MSATKHMSDLEIHDEIVRIEARWDRLFVAGLRDEANQLLVRRNELADEQRERKGHSAAAVIRLRFLAGETGRSLDAACAEALGWRVSRDPWWNWHPGPVYDPPGDDWCIRRDGRNDKPCNEALPSFTAEAFERALPLPNPPQEDTSK